MVRTNSDWKNHCKLIVGTYFKLNYKTEPYSPATPHTHDAIVIGPTGNITMTYIFVCLNTGHIFKRLNCTEYPITQRIINTVKHLGVNSKKTEYVANLEFRNSTKDIFEWDI